MRSPRHELGTTPTVYNRYKPHLGARGGDGGVRQELAGRVTLGDLDLGGPPSLLAV
jgi:hypothetical protein